MNKILFISTREEAIKKLIIKIKYCNKQVNIE